MDARGEEIIVTHIARTVYTHFLGIALKEAESPLHTQKTDRDTHNATS